MVVEEGEAQEQEQEEGWAAARRARGGAGPWG